MPHHANMKYTTCCHYLSRMWLLLVLSVWELLLGYKAMLVLIVIHGASSSSRCMAIMRTSLPATFSYSLISASALSGSQKGHGLTRDAIQWSILMANDHLKQTHMQNETDICMLNEKNDYIMWEKKNAINLPFADGKHK